MDKDLKRRYRELAHQLKDQLAAGASHVELSDPTGAVVHVRRDQDGTLQIDAPAAGHITSRFWQPSAERPSEYPAEIPFLAGTAAFTGVASGAASLVMVQWWEVHDVVHVLELLMRETLDDGWVEAEPLTPTTEPVGERCQFVRGRFKRIISRVGGSDPGGLMLMQAELPAQTA